MVERNHAVPSQCPVCSHPLHIEKVRCGTCGSAVEGHFALDWPSRLTKEQLGFVKVFVTCAGKIKDVEEALGISYPTVVSRLDEVMAAVRGDDAPPPAPKTRLEVLERLSRGELTSTEAERLLKKDKS